MLIDLAGGASITGPGGEGWANPEIREVLATYHEGQGADAMSVASRSDHRSHI